MEVAQDKLIKIENIALSIIKLIILGAVAIISSWCTSDLLGACISVITFMATVLMDSIIQKIHIRQMHLSNGVEIASWVFIIAVVLFSILTLLGILFNIKDGFTFEGYKIVAMVFLLCFALVDTAIEILLAVRTKD